MKPTRLIIGILTCLVLLLSTCVGCLNERLKDAGCTLVDSVVYRDTGSVTFKDRPVPDYITLPGTTDTIRDTFLIPSQTDTAAILADYFRTRHYFNSWDTLDVSVALKEAVTANRIESRELTIQNNRATRIEQVFENPPKNRILLGGFADWEPFGAGLGAGWLTKKYTLFQYQYDLINGSHRATIMMTP